ncbi:hypothetical protein ABPG72_007230 [Tetrahymena utriculariae]
MADAQYKCRKHHSQFRNKICLEKGCYTGRKFEVELCEKCYKNGHSQHQTVSLELFLEYLKTGLSHLRIQELENEEGLPKDIQEIAAFLQSELANSSIPKKIRNYLFDRVREFHKKRHFIFTKLSKKLKLQKQSSQRIFKTRLLFHYARDLYLGLKKDNLLLNFSFIILPVFKEEISLSLTFTKEHYFNPLKQQFLQFPSEIGSSHSCFMPTNCAVSTNPSSSTKLQMLSSGNQMAIESEGNQISSMQNIQPEGKRYKLNLNLFQGQQANSFIFGRKCLQPSYYMQKMFLVGKGFVAYQCSRHLYYYNLQNNQIQIIHSLPKLHNMQMMVEELNSKEMCIFEGNELRIVCKLTGATLCFQKTERVNQIRALNSSKVAYFSQYVIHIWDRDSRKVTNTIKLNLLAIQDIIEISKNRVCIGANDNFLFIYDLAKKKFIKKLDLEPYQKDRNLNCDNLIFTKINNNLMLTSFRGSRCISFWNLNTYKCIRTVMLPNDSLFSVAKLNCHALALGCLNKFHIFDTVTGEIVRTIQTKQQNQDGDERPELIGSIYSYDDKTILTLSQNCIKVFN